MRRGTASPWAQGGDSLTVPSWAILFTALYISLFLRYIHTLLRGENTTWYQILTKKEKKKKQHTKKDTDK